MHGHHSVQLIGVTKNFGSFTAVDSLSLTIPQGSIYGFLGPNGAGKTTTIRMIMSIFQPDQGEIHVLGHRDASRVKDRLGYLPEEKGRYKKMKTLDIITYFGELKGLSRGIARERARALLIRYGLKDWIYKKTETLSKGMGQKVQVLGTLVHQPELVILDEPFSGLDPVNVELMRQIILDMKKEGKTVIFSTHVMEQAEQICDFIFLINQGKKVLDGTLSDVRRSVGRGIKIDYNGDGSLLQTMEGVVRVNDAGKSAEIFLEDGYDPQRILQNLVGKLEIRKFDLSEPSLHEVFIRAVGGSTNA
jgi:ABC-2 type transport system ATP-binding protein